MEPLIRATILIALIGASCAKGMPVENAANAPPSGGGASDAGPTIQPSSAGTLLEPDATIIHAVSPDQMRILVSHQPSGTPPDDLSLVTIGEDTKTLVVHGAYTARFSPDGESIVFDTQSGRQPGDLNLARADGSEQRQLTARTFFYAFAGTWLYYSDEAGTDVSLYRVATPDGDPELIATFPPPHSSWGPLSASPSPDGESVVYCHSPAVGSEECFLRADGRTMPVRGPASFWAPDGSWFLDSPCEIVVVSGAVRQVCGDATHTGTAMSKDGKFLALLVADGSSPVTQARLQVHLYSVARGTDRLLPTPGPFDGTVFRPSLGVIFTPDGSRLIATLGASLFSAPTAGGAWVQISKDGASDPRHGTLAVSDDSRIIAIAGSLGVVESIDGAAPRAIGPSGSTFPGGTLTVFEPRGGLGKALFVEPRASGNAWMANADGTGWQRLPDADECEWSERAALCVKMHPDPLSITSNDLSVTMDDGKQLGVVAQNVERWVVAGRKLFYVRSGGGLYTLDVPQP